MPQPHEAHIDQAPQYQHDPEAAADDRTLAEKLANPEHIDQTYYRETPLSDVPEDVLLDGLHNRTHEEVEEVLTSPAAFRENIPGQQKPRLTRGKKMLAYGAGVLTVGGAAFGIGLHAASGSPDNESDARADRPSTSAPANPGQESVAMQEGTMPQESVASQEVDYSKIDVQTLTVEQFYDDSVYPQEYRIKWANEIIKQREQQAYAELNNILTSHGYQPLGALVEPSETNTPQEIMVQHNVVEYLATTSQNADEGMKLLAASGSYEIVRNAFDEFAEGKPIITSTTVLYDGTTQAAMASPVFRHAAAGNYVPGGVPSIVATVNSSSTDKTYQTVERFVGGRYISVDVRNVNDPDFANYPETIKDN